MRKEIIFWEEPQQVAHFSNKIVSKKEPKKIDNSVKIEKLQKKIEDLKNKWTWKQPYTHRRQRFLDWYTAQIEQYEKQIEELGGKVLEKRNFELERKIKGQLLRKIPWYFPTPMEVVRKMVEFADIQNWDIVIEPSCWTWNIIDWILETWKDIWLYWIELNYSNFEILQEKYKDTKISLQNRNWLDVDFSSYLSEKPNKILLNPPFEQKQDMQHILYSWNNLADWWTLVAICTGSATSRSDYQPLRDLILEYWEYFDNWEQFLRLDSWTFKMSGTMVGSILIVLKKD